MLHPNSLFHLGGASCSLWTWFWSSVSEVHQIKTNHPQLSPGRNLRSSLPAEVGLSFSVRIKYPFKCQTIQLCTKIILLEKHTRNAYTRVPLQDSFRPIETVSSGLAWISDAFNCSSHQISSSKRTLTKIKKPPHKLDSKWRSLNDEGFSDSTKAAAARLVVSNP